jgi:hypothetical protein
MENFEKGETTEIELPDHREPFVKILSLPEDFLLVKVRGGSKIQTMVDVAIHGLTVSALPCRVVLLVSCSSY